jgi:hypothetical protein
MGYLNFIKDILQIKFITDETINRNPCLLK